MISTSLFRNVFTDLKNPSLDKLKQPFASSISQSANCFVVVVVVHFLFKKKKKWRRALPTVKGHSPILSNLQSWAWFLHAQSQHFHIWATFLALIPPPFKSLNLFKKFFRPLQLHSSSHNVKICMRIPGSTLTLLVNNRECSHAKQAVQTKSVRLWMSKENFHKELSRIILNRLYYIS